MSKIANFTTSLPKGDESPFKFIVYGDQGIEEYPQGVTTIDNVRKEIDETKVRFVNHIGDLGYALGYVRLIK